MENEQKPNTQDQKYEKSENQNTEDQKNEFEDNKEESSEAGVFPEEGTSFKSVIPVLGVLVAVLLIAWLIF